MIDVPFLSYETLKRHAEGVLQSSSAKQVFPVDIEIIVESDFEIEIIPIRGLQAAYQIDAFLSKDLTTISVDDAVLETRLNRYRFSLAHELGHRVLHSQILKNVEFDTIASWKLCVSTFPDRQYGFLEYQANTFANALLVPQSELERRFAKCIGAVRDANLSPEDYPNECLDYISSALGKQFQVSAETMRIRLDKEQFIHQI